MIDSISKISSLTKSSAMDGVGTESSATASLSGSIPAMGLQGVTKADTTPGTATGMGFGEIVGGMMTDAIKSLKTAETNAVGGMLGKVSTRDVVDSMMTAERSLQTAITLRDKIVSAYLDITKMQI
ncbi:flagellar hook-basal body complex protein FliE [Rhizobium sp.]|jgi:flagellar hook-basal body complex protein FliE|uniref:flagellar hook-basal body complex protein FliE n=1 Tax=Rhizobium sp. TaxID=391 RepID=UPI000E86D42B|nr:flagellar hook-basal body protein FliE [Rhizobium sp.]